MHGHSANSTAECKVSMLWNWYTIDACFLSTSWQITSQGTFAASCIGVVLLVVLLEALRRVGKEFDNYILREFQGRLSVLSAAAAPGDSPHTVTFRASPLQQLIRAMIHAVTFGVAYLVMMIIMYFNGYLFICVLIGAGLGKFLCDWMSTNVVVGGPGANKGCGLGATASGIEEPSVCCG